MFILFFFSKRVVGNPFQTKQGSRTSCPDQEGRKGSEGEVIRKAAFFFKCCCLVAKLSYVTPLIVAHQAPVSMGFPRQEYWHGLSFPSSADLPNPGINVSCR